ncbi:SPOR domain-containing protein [Microvirga sp. 2YAF29]|uniref:SPOR domain-containing protein n=1 Tax=Microvirga sp. 2YAF29 TaxID=3233031 RepID=UPI003F9D1565
MNESVKPRFAVDMNDIERQLAQAGASQAQPFAATRSDPLAELARIVGQDDPFQAILATDGAATPRQQTSPIDDLFATRDTMTPGARPAQAPARQPAFEVSDFELDQYAQPQAPTSAQVHAYQQPAQAAQAGSYDNQAYADDYYDDNGQGYDDQGYGQPERLNYPPVEKPRSRKGLLAMGAVVGAIVIGGGGAYLFSGTSVGAGGEPPLVVANTEPVKVEPQNPGGVEIPNQNKQIYERAQQSETKIVNREEQPVDVGQAVRNNGGSAVADATGATAHGAHRQNGNSLNLGEPRKVRTVTIRPDGTVAGAAPEAHAAPARSNGPAPVPTLTLPEAAQATPPQMASAQPRPASSTPAAAPKPIPVAATPTAAPATPAATPAPQRVASAQPVAVAPAQAMPEATTTVTGGFSVQLGLANSEGAAETAYSSYQRKYSDLESMPSLIRKAEVNGKEIYRVRVGPMSREEASSLCSKLQGQGGQCFVAKN